MTTPRISRYVDTVAVERAVKGDLTVNLTRAEIAAAFDELEVRGHSAAEIAAILGVTERTVCRWRTGRYFPVSRTTSGPLAERRGLAVTRPRAGVL